MSPAGSGTQSTTAAGGAALAALGLAMFVYVIDTTIMSVSISNLVVDLDTSLSNVRTAITVYTLTMAAFMITGGKLVAIWGARRTFQIGLVVYGVGTVMTAAAPDYITLLIGWSILEGLGSALIVPATNTLVRANFEGAARASAYGLLGGVAAAGAAVGPLVGGWLTTTFTWRVAFVAEAVIVAGVLLLSLRVTDAAREGRVPRLDVLGVVLSAAGLGMLIFGILQSGDRGWGSPIVWTLLVAGLVVLVAFVLRSLSLERRGGDPLIRLSIFRHSVVNAGVPVTIAQTFAQNGILYLVPVFSQLVLGLDALQTGLTVLPLSAGVMIFAVGTSRLGHRIAPRLIIQVGLLTVFAGGVLLAFALPDAEGSVDLALGMFAMGAGIGLISAQLPNLLLSGVDEDETGEASGLQGTAQNFGMSLGTAVAGSVLIVTLGSAFSSAVADSEVLPDDTRTAIEEVLEENSETVGTQIEELLADQPDEVVDETLRIAEDSGVGAFQLTMLVMGLVALVGYVWAFRLPRTKLGGEVVDEAVRGTQMIPKLQLEPTAPQS